MAYRRKDAKGKTAKHYLFQARARTGYKQLSAGTTSKPMAEKIEAMWYELAEEQRAWDLLDPVLDSKDRAASIGALYDQYVAAGRRAEGVRQIQTDSKKANTDIDIEPQVEAFLAVYRSRGTKPATADHIETHLRWLLPAGDPCLRSTVTAAWLTTKLAEYKGTPRKGREGCSQNTRRKVHSSWSNFFAYLVKPCGVWPVSPMADVERPKKEKPPVRFYEFVDVQRILAAAPTQELRALWAFMYGTSCEITPALALRRSDFDEPTHEVRVIGTKTNTRDRICQVADWAWPIVAAHMRTLLPAAKLWPELSRYTPSDRHAEVVLDLKLTQRLPLYNSRHHWAAPRARLGVPIAVIQQQLGHSTPSQTLEVYGRFYPASGDRAAWEAKFSASIGVGRPTLVVSSPESDDTQHSDSASDSLDGRLVAATA